MVADGVGKANHVEPADGQPFAIIGRRQEPIDELLVCKLCVFIGRLDEGIHLVGARWQAEDVERQPADQSAWIGLGRQLETKRGQSFPHQHVDGVGPRLDVGPDRLFVGPVTLVGRALHDPLLQEILLRGGQLLVGLGRRHDLFGVRACDAGDEGTGPWDGRRYGPRADRQVPDVEPQAGFAFALVGTMALQAVFGEDGANVAIEEDFRSGRGRSSGPKQEAKERCGGAEGGNSSMRHGR